MARFGRVLTAMVTPFDDNGALDLDAAQHLARWLPDGNIEFMGRIDSQVKIRAYFMWIPTAIPQFYKVEV